MKNVKRAKFSGCFSLGLKNIFGVLDNPKRTKSSPKRAKLASLPPSKNDGGYIRFVMPFVTC